MQCNVVTVALFELACLLFVGTIEVLLWWRLTCGGMIWLSVEVVEWWGGGDGVGWSGVVVAIVIGVDGWEGRRSPALGVEWWLDGCTGDGFA